MNSMSEDGVTTIRGEFWGTKPETGGARGTRGTVRIRRLRLILQAGALAAIAGAAPAMAADITACGATISKPGFYRVVNDLAASSGDCIDVSAPRAIVFLNGHQLTGNGSGVGVRFFARAKESFLEGANATISGFAIGVEDDAALVHGDNFNSNGNLSGGLLVSGAPNSTFSNFQASNNGGYGVLLMSGAGDVAESAQASSNGSYGIWLDGAKDARVDNFDTEQNATAGVYIGCASNGPGGSCSGGAHIGSGNQVYDGFADGDGQYGVAIDANASANLVTSVEAMNNSSADLTDLSKCGANSWFGNAFTSANPSGCIN